MLFRSEGDLARLKELLDAGADVDGADGSGLTALHWASAWGHADACRLLIERGAEVGARDGRDATPLHAAAFFGRPDAVRVLLEGGADPSLRDEDGTSPADLADWPWDEARVGLTRFMAGLMSVPLDETTIEGDLAATAELLQRSALDRLLKDLGEFSLGHLWFLWYLMGLLVLGLPLFAIAARWAPAGTSALYVSPLALVVVVPLTATFQAIMLHTGLTFFGPSTSSVLVHDPVVLAYYGVFFLFGAAVRGIDPDTRSLTRGWPVMLAVAIVIFLAAGDAAESARGGEFEALVPAVMQAAFAWTMTLGLIGLFAKLFRRERAWVRYLSDASYWIYLAHMPLV